MEFEAFMNSMPHNDVSAAELFGAIIHHCWQRHPLKIEPAITLVSFSSNLAIDVAAIRSIKLDSDGDYCIAFKDINCVYIPADTPEWHAVHDFLILLAKKQEEEH